MRLKVACLLSAVTLIFALPVRADETAWNPFLFTPFCSTCGPQSPLTLEQADAVELLFGAQVLGPAIPITPPPIGDNDSTPPPENIGRQGPPTLSVLPASVLPATSGGSGSGGSGGSASNGSSSSSSGNNQNSGGVEYGVNANQNVVTFTTNDVNTNGINTDVLSDTSGGGGDQGGGQTLVPEPTTLVLFGTGLALVSTRLRRRRTAGR